VEPLKDKPPNLFEHLLVPATGERFENLLEHESLVIERIVSSAAPEPTSYDQAHDEWVLLVQGEAELEVLGERVSLRPGDYLFLPAHTAHKVLKTSAGAVWLAVHLRSGKSSLPGSH